MKRSFSILIFAYYLIVLGFTVIRRDVQSNSDYDLVPFSSWRTLLSVPYEGHGEYILKEIIINVLMMAPVGIVFGLSRSSALPRCLAVGLLISISIEFIQYCTRTGLCETDDVIHNTLGCLIGYGVGRLFLHFTKKKIRPEQSL